MTAQKGSLVLIKCGDGGTPEIFSTLGGMRMTRLALNNQVLDATHVESGAWRQLLAAGVRHMTLSGNGLFTDSASEELLRSHAFTGSINDYQLQFGNGDAINGSFLVGAYERAGNYDGAETYTLTLESAGTVAFIAG